MGKCSPFSEIGLLHSVNAFWTQIMLEKNAEFLPDLWNKWRCICYLNAES